MIIGARMAAWAKIGGGVLTAKDYVQDGLIAMWDGIENAGWGKHDASATVWKDLVGGLDITLPSSAQIKDNHLLLEAEGASSTNKLIIDTTKDYTVDVLFVYGDEGEDATYGQWQVGMLAGISFANMFFRYDVYWSGSRIFNTPATWNLGLYAPSNCRIPGATFRINQSRGKFDIYYNGVLYHQDIDTGTKKTAAQVKLVPSHVHQYTYAMRVYSRALTTEEIAANYAIDKARFNLPD